MPATTSIRWALTKHLIEILRASEQLAGVQIEPGFPGDRQEAESIWVDGLDGEVNIPVAKADRMHRDDKFDIPFQIRVAGKVDLDETMQRVSEIVAGIEDPLATDPHLEDYAGAIVAAEITDERMTAGEIKGAGWVGFAEVVVNVWVRLT